LLGTRLIVAIAIFACPALARADGTPAARLFDAGVKNTPASVAEAKKQYERWKATDPSDVRVDYAYALVLVEQHRYGEALTKLNGYLESGSAELGDHCYKLWIQVQDRRYKEALADAVAISRRLPEQAGVRPERQYVEVAQFLGGLFGYLERARPEAVDAETLLQSKNEVLHRLGPQCLLAFDQVREEVVNQIAGLQDDLAGEREAIVKKAAEKAKETLGRQAGVVAQQHDAIESSKTQLADANQKFEVLQAQVRSLQTERARLGVRIAAIETQYQEMAEREQTSTTVRDRRVPGRDNPTTTRTTTSDVLDVRRSLELLPMANQLALLYKQVFDIDRRTLALAAEMSQASETYERESNAVIESQELTKKAQRKAAAAEKHLQRPPKRVTNGRIAQLSAELIDFETYVPFPLEAEKERVLGWFSK
jgi:hypothetical protein